MSAFIIVFLDIYTTEENHQFKSPLTSVDHSSIFPPQTQEVTFLITNKTIPSQADQEDKQLNFTNDTTDVDSVCHFQASTILLGTHHKTGTVLLHYSLRRTILTYIRSICTHYEQNYDLRFKLDEHLTSKSIKDFVTRHQTSCMKNQHLQKTCNMKNNVHQNCAKPYIVRIINMIRNPVDTIFSAYFYHKKAIESWVLLPISKGYDNNLNVNDKKEQCSLQVFLDYQTNYTHEVSSKDSKYHSHITNHSSIAQIYATNSIQFGLFMEYQRYQKCQFDEMYYSFQTIKEMNDINSKDDGYQCVNVVSENIMLEDFFDDFNSTCQHLLTSLNINNKHDRVSLLNKFQQFTIQHQTQSMMSRNSYNTFDKNKYAEILLTSKIDDKICQTLKNQTLLLGYKWIYTKFC